MTASRSLVLVGHGSARNPNAKLPALQHAEALRRRGAFLEVKVAYWKEDPHMSTILSTCTGREIVVVPLFMAAGYYTEEVIPREMKLAGRITWHEDRLIRTTRPIGVHPRIAELIVQRAEEAGATPEDALVVLGHGTPRNPNSGTLTYEQAEQVRAMNRFREVATVFIDQEPNMKDVFTIANAPNMVMVPALVADGWHADETVPEDMGLEQGEVTREGRRLCYAAAVGTHPGVVDIIEELIAEADTWPAA